MRSPSAVARNRAAVIALALAATGLGGGFGICQETLPDFPTIDALSAETKEQIFAQIASGTPPAVETVDCAGQAPGDPNACPGVATPFQHLAQEPGFIRRFTSQGLQSGAFGGFFGDAYLFVQDSDFYQAGITFDMDYGNFLFISSPNSKVEVTVSQVEWGGAPLDLTCEASVQMAGGPLVNLPVGATTLVDVPGSSGAVAADWSLDCDGEALEVEGSLDFPAAARVTVEWGPIAQACTNDAQCPPEAPFCHDGTCRTGAEGQRCSNLFDCADGLYCSGRTSRCQGGFVFEPCDIDEDCPNAHACVNFLCREGNPGDPCVDGADCQSGVCSGGACG